MWDTEKSKAIESALSQIDRQFGKGSVMRMSDKAAQNVPVVSTGIVGLDVALGAGGFPLGRIIEVFGPESSGKTTLALHVVAEIQKAGGIAAFIDAEHALDVVYARKLGVNIDHVATVRQARQIHYPDPVVAALLAEEAGADSIVAHLREDRRHINERDIRLLKSALTVALNMEMSIAPDIVAIALKVRPPRATLVPEKRKELTTEGGLDLAKQYSRVRTAVDKLTAKAIEVSLFIDPVKRQIDKAKAMGVPAIEFNTGGYCQAKTKTAQVRELGKIKEAVIYAGECGCFVAAGHGLDCEKIKPLLKIRGIEEFNIGHSIIARSVFVGMMEAVKEMIDVINNKTRSTKSEIRNK